MNEYYQLIEKINSLSNRIRELEEYCEINTPHAREGFAVGSKVKFLYWNHAGKCEGRGVIIESERYRNNNGAGLTVQKVMIDFLTNANLSLPLPIEFIPVGSMQPF